MTCKDCKTALPDLILDPAASENTTIQTHLASCAACNEEFISLQATFELLDLWLAPEPSPYFDQKLAVRLREEQAAPPAGWFERLRSSLLFNTGRQFRPALAGALALVLLLGGGTAVTLNHLSSKTPASATIRDLQTLDKDAQVLQVMDQLLQEDNSSEEPTTPVI